MQNQSVFWFVFLLGAGLRNRNEAFVASHICAVVLCGSSAETCVNADELVALRKFFEYFRI